MKNKLTYCSLLFLLMATTFQCTKDPDLIARNDSYNDANFPVNIDQMYSVLIPAYSALRRNMFNREYPVVLTYNLEHTTDVAFAGDINWLEAARNNLNATNSYAANVWGNSYMGIKNTNVFLERLEFYKKNFIKPGEDPLLNRMKGEALFLRGQFYFYLIRLFGESYIRSGSGGEKMGVPITNLATNLELTQVSRKSVREVYNYIIADLKEAEILLKGHTWPTADRGRVNEWAVKGLLGKVYVFTEDWANAKTKLKEVIDGSGKRLMQFDKYQNAFNGDVANEYNEESLFELNVDRDVTFPTSDVRNLSTVLGLVIAPSFLGANGTEETAGALGFGNQFFHDKNLQRFGFTLPIWTLVTNPKFDIRKAPTPTNPAQILDPVYLEQSLNIRNNKTADPRLYIAALQPWVDSVSSDGGKTWLPVARYKEIPLARRKSYYGWSHKKYATFDNSVFNLNRNDASNQYLLRLADVYLLYAEVSQRTGDNVTALEYVNKVHRRAYGFGPDAVSPVDYASLTDRTKAPDLVLKNDPIKYERWAELFGEMHWWFDVCRWRIGKSEAAYYQASVGGGDIQWDDAKSYSLPIPTAEMNTNVAVKQNPGY